MDLDGNCLSRKIGNFRYIEEGINQLPSNVRNFSLGIQKDENNWVKYLENIKKF